MSLDVRAKLPLPAEGSVAVNSGRNALLALLDCMQEVTCVLLPDFYCPDVESAIEQAGYSIQKYHVTENLECVLPEDISDCRRDEKCVILTDYFGIRKEYVAMQASRIGKRTIIDNCQSWWGSVPEEGGVFYSPRKFFGVADGGFALIGANRQRTLEKLVAGLPQGRSVELYEGLLMRTDCDAETGFRAFRKAEENIASMPPASMSRLTTAIFSNCNVDEIKDVRSRNFRILHDRLYRINALEDIDSDTPGLVYPLVISDKFAIRELRKRLQSDRIYCPRYWPGCGHKLTEFLLPLPVDQRCGSEDMERLADKVIDFMEQV